MIYRAVVIGCGNIGSAFSYHQKAAGVLTHASAYSLHPQTHLAAVCDVDIEKAKECARFFQADAYDSNIERILHDYSPEIVSICTSNASHGEILELALSTPSVKGVLIEKPLALDLYQAAKLVHLAREKGVVLAVNYSRRYSEGFQKIQKYIASGTIGSIQKVSGYYTKGIFHNGTHWLDLARWWIGEITRVQALNVRKKEVGDIELDAHLDFANGASGALQVLDSNAYSLFEMDVLGTSGRVQMTDSGFKIECFGVVDSPVFQGYKVLKSEFMQPGQIEGALFNAVSSIIKSVETGVPPICTGEDGLVALQLAQALFDSSEQAKPVDVRGVPFGSR